MYKRCEKNKKCMMLSVLLSIFIMMMAIGWVSAYFTDEESAENRFTVGNISISLTEPNWNEDNGKNMTPGQRISKDPQITNDGANDAYVFIEVTVPAANIKTADTDGSLKAAAMTELFSYNVNDGWSLVDKKSSVDAAIYTYAYATKNGKMKPLCPYETTQPVFDSVSFVNAVEGQIDGSNLAINVKSMGIQADNLDVDTPADVYSVLKTGKAG